VKLEAMAPSARYVGAMLALMFVVSGAVRAEPAFSFDATPGKLRKSVVPISYSIELRPDAESLALPGVEVIDVEVREPTARLTLNAVNTTFASVTVDDSLTRADVTLDAAAETATFIFAQPLAAGAHRLRIEFTARINKFDRGFFFERLRYYYAAASARNPALAHLTLALTLTDEVPGTIVTGLIGSVASSAEQPDLAWDFLQKNYDALFAKRAGIPRPVHCELHDQFQRRGPCRRTRSFRAGSGDFRRPRDGGPGAGGDCDLCRPQSPRAARGRGLDQGAQMTTTRGVLGNVALPGHSG
jgi:hypothetical protein